jgi:hypothetical protein
MLCKDLPKSLPRDGRRRVLLAVKRPSQALFVLERIAARSANDVARRQFQAAQTAKVKNA